MVRTVLPIDARRPSWFLLLLLASHLTTGMADDTTLSDLSTAAAAASSSPSQTVLQSSTATTPQTPQTHTIQIGLLDHKMRPETTEAAVGDFIQFDFYPLNHSVVRAEYGFPCVPYEMTGTDKKGFFSGFRPVDRVLDRPPEYTVQINDTEAIFFYCSAPGSCITYGMVGGINLNSSMSIDKQRTLAMDSAYMLQPGEPFPAESPLPSGNPASSVLPSPSPSTSLSPSVSVSHTSGGLSKGAIAGIVVAAVCAVLFGALLFFCWGRTKSLREAIDRRDGTVRRVSASPNQIMEYSNLHHHVQPHHVHDASHAGYQTPAPPAGHPGSPSSGYGHQHQNSAGTGYLPTNHPAKYTSSTATHPGYHTVSPGSPPPGSMGLNGHPFMHSAAHDPSSRGTPAPGYYETFPHGQAQEQVRERPVEMEAITAVSTVVDTDEVNRASKF
ncbi:uncharacterized protein EKO05_0011131 [Ascochyta rabiei]|uniref:Uncharacterized protein n=1 Tax=Didymella rabiei TaxID=5454 RepID=A0A163A769_DIDRA|nr:uncharacterized protein EKO05_0011131 [Ascochyta rabiei]KZM21025.1 hypothetical protein ST47_g7808 [Ascochyta rabiei]UPX20919.1 hypothetical protein EKO05_0011131 [Ascochyta rabiei]